MISDLDSIEIKIKKLKNSLNLNSFEINVNDSKTIYFKKKFHYWKFSDKIERIFPKEFFTSLEIKLRELDEFYLQNVEKLKNFLELDFLQNINNYEFKIFQFLNEFNFDYNKIIAEINDLNNNKKIILTNPDGTYGISYYHHFSDLFKESWNVKLPEKKELQKIDSDLWLPREEIVKNFLFTNQILGYNLINIKKAQNLFNFCSTAYISKTTHLLLRKLNLVIIISSRLF